MAAEVTKEFLEEIKQLISANDEKALLNLLSEEHPADIAEIIDELDLDNATYLFKLLDSEQTAEALLEIHEDDREKILKNLSAEEIADEIDEMDTDDAVDIIQELPVERVEKVISEIEDDSHAKDIVELLNYEEGTAGSLMAKELVKVKETWMVPTCVRKMRSQAQEVTRVHSIYVVDKENRLIGRLSLKDLLVASPKDRVSDIYIPKVDSVHVSDKGEDVALLMQKYDLEAIPVVDDDNTLIGRITIDDIVDLIKEEAEKDYQMAAGITEDIDADDSILDKTKARLPWLILGLVGGLAAASIMGGFEEALTNFPELFYFTPLIAAMAGNVGVQSSAIIVQGLANNNIKGSMINRMFKEIGLSIINGVLLAALIFVFGFFLNYSTNISVTISISLIMVIILASLIGTFVPLILDKNGIDPAVATGPFITTSNDIFGIFIFFYIAKLILGF
ncbi:magnesium transporter [Lutimonas zeaxanthinifaciens]|uniref:magnesium transporter n=1 Tax=Lutimonas zeaxanthinifaciens TaxID=3060215 RepID=UPI00265CA113|nr:magnesium transporter [Lutimonas sp. YSD2104]WKK65503.1 magnesium transporter [Lutimonas sp. YSD2104]